MTTTAPNAELTSDQAVTLVRSLGRKITLTTWRGYVHRGEAPGPARHVGRTPLWDEAEIRDWAADPAGWRVRSHQAAIDAAVREARRQIVAAIDAEAARLAAERQDPAIGAAYTVSESYVSGIEHAAMIAHRARIATTTKDTKDTP